MIVHCHLEKSATQKLRTPRYLYIKLCRHVPFLFLEIVSEFSVYFYYLYAKFARNSSI